MKAKSIKGTSAEEIKSALQQSMADGFRPTLAIAFVSVKQDRKAICQLLDEAGIAIFGATTNGGFMDDQVELGTAAIMLLDMNQRISKFILRNTQTRTTAKLPLALPPDH